MILALIERVKRWPPAWRVAHLLPSCYLLIGLSYMVLDIQRVRYYSFWHIAIILPASFIMGLCQVSHERALCALCASRTPLDQMMAAYRCRYELRTYHWEGSFYLGLILIMIIPAVIAAFFSFPGEGPDSIWPLLISDLGLMWVAWYLRSSLIHRILQPWCPRCKRWDEGGSKECSPEPTPDPSGVRQ